MTEWRYDMKLHVENASNDIVIFLAKARHHLMEAETPSMDAHQITQKDFNNTRDLAPRCAHNVLRWMYLARRFRPDMMWKMYILVRSATQWNQARGNILARLSCYIATQVVIAHLDCFKTHLSQETCSIPKSTSSEVCIWTTNMRPIFLDVQETNSNVSLQCRIRYNVAGRRFENGRHTTIAIVGLCCRKLVRIPTPGKRFRAQMASVIHCLIPLIVSWYGWPRFKQHSRELSPSQGSHFWGQRHTHSYVHWKSQSQFETCHEPTVMTWIGSLERISLDNTISFR